MPFFCMFVDVLCVFDVRTHGVFYITDFKSISHIRFGPFNIFCYVKLTVLAMKDFQRINL